MPSEVMYTQNSDFSGGRRFRSNSAIAESITSSTSGSLTFLKKLWKEKKTDKRLAILEYEETSSNSPSPTMFRKNRRASAQSPTLLHQNNNNNNNNNCTLKVEETRSRSPSPSLFRRGLGRRSSTSNEKTQENLLHYHVSHQDYHALEKLLSENEMLDVNYMRPPGVTALHQACTLGNIKIVRLLVQRGANIQQKTWSELSPLKIAVLSGCYELAQYLVAVGANSDDIKDGCQIERTNNSPRRNNSF